MATLSPFRFVLIAFMISSAALFTVSGAANDQGDDQYTYGAKEITGPKMWGSIKPEWKSCESGKKQSPIDVVKSKVKVDKSLGALKTKYKAAPATITSRGHDVSVSWNGDAGGVTIGGDFYKLIQIHWHSPSEHKLDGKGVALEGHMVHKNGENIAVIGILYEVGAPCSFLDKVLTGKKITKEGTNVGSVDPGEVKFDRKEYYRYDGSLTTPPCTEGVTWTLLKKVESISAKQLKTLADAVDPEYKKNARPLQDATGRTVYSNNNSVVSSPFKRGGAH